jgi:hypothetical protein
MQVTQASKTGSGTILKIQEAHVSDIDEPTTFTMPPATRISSIAAQPEHIRSADEQLAELSKDISTGIATVLQLLEFDEQEAEVERPLFNNQQRGQLLRLAIASASLLSTSVERHIEERQLHYEET